jgi:exopolysaccharide biosynthesis protein
MTIEELSALMRELGAVSALNLDGGGSTTMVVAGRVVNSPSDASGERPVSDALLVFPR